MTVWRTTVDQLMHIFRDALRAIAPQVERARIAWRDGAAYDDWDEIAQVLYTRIVLSSVLWAMPDDERDDIQFPAYDCIYESYSGKAVIVVHCMTEGRLVFHSFAPGEGAFDKVRACKIDGDARMLDADFVLLDADTVTYSVETLVRKMFELDVDM